MSAARQVCGVPAQGERLLDESQFDAFERDALTLIRLVCGIMGQKGIVHGPSVAAAAGALFPPDMAGSVACATIELMQVVALGRTERFGYSNPSCPDCARVLTGCERLLLEMIHAARRGRTGAAIVAASMLCDRSDPGRLVDAALGIAAAAPLSRRAAPTPLPSRHASH